MGNWRITIEGHGQHHNKQAADAENLASDFVEQLKRRGHEVSSATFALQRRRENHEGFEYAPDEPIKPPDATINLEQANRSSPVDPPSTGHPKGYA